VIINPMPVRPLLAFTVFFPKAGAWLADQLGANDFFRNVVEAIRHNKSEDRVGKPK
jgi:hypothetical protein